MKSKCTHKCKSPFIFIYSGPGKWKHSQIKYFQIIFICIIAIVLVSHVILVRVIIATMKHEDYRKVRENGIICLHFLIIVHHWKKSGNEQKQGWN